MSECGLVVPPKMVREVDVETTWGFPADIDPSTVIFFGEDDFALVS